MEHRDIRTEAGSGMHRVGGRRHRQAPASPPKPPCVTPALRPPPRAAPWSVGAGERFPRSSGGGARLHAAERPFAPCMLMSSPGRAAPINCWKYLLTYQMGSRGAKAEGRVSQRRGGTELPAPATLRAAGTAQPQPGR